MPILRQLTLAICILTGTVLPAGARQQFSNSLQQALSKTLAPAQRVQLLLDLKDLNEDSNLNVPLSIQLFREAAAIEDIYAMNVAIVPIVTRYAPYPEMEDSLNYYIRTLRALTRGKPQEGIADYVEMAIGFNRLFSNRSRSRNLGMARETKVWSDSLAAGSETVCQRAKRLLLLGYANQILARYGQAGKDNLLSRVRMWEEAYALTHRMEEVMVRKYFANIIFVGLSNAYNQLRRYDDQVRLSDDYIGLLDAFCAADKATGRRGYLYTDNGYVRPYRQLMRGALSIEREDLAAKHFHDLRERLLNAGDENLDRNKTYLYELGYQWNALKGDYATSIRYNDSLRHLIGQGKGYFRMIPEKIYQINLDRSVMLSRAGRYKEAVESFAHTSGIQDSIFSNERRERSQTILRLHQMDKLKLSETRAVIRNRVTALVSFSAVAILLLGTGLYLYRTWLRNRRMQLDIVRDGRKARESEHMKSIFVNTICRGIGPHLDRIDCAVHSLMIARENPSERRELLESIRNSTVLLLSTLDNMLEAANLDSLTDHLQTEPTDVEEVCRAELLTASHLERDNRVEYRIDSPQGACTVRTHRKYFTFVIRALLDNAGNATEEGSITLGYQADPVRNILRVTVTDTGCGVPPERRANIFCPVNDDSKSSRGLSLPLCRVIAGHLSGTITLDQNYGPGARFVFTVPLQP